MTADKIQAYLDRIGFPYPDVCDEETLREMTRAHLVTVPFESLEPSVEGREPSLEEEDLYRKVVENHRGGYCFELNKIYNILLKSLGYDCYPIPVRIIMGRPEPCPFSHRGIMLRLNGQRWYVDVGFGGLGPKGIINLEESGIQTIVGESFRVAWEGDVCVIIRVEPDKEIRMLAFRDVEWLECDFLYWNGFFATNPGSPFRNKRICYMCTPTGWISQVENMVSVFDNGVTTSRELGSEEEIRSFIMDSFKVKITQWIN